MYASKEVSHYKKFKKNISLIKKVIFAAKNNNSKHLSHVLIKSKTTIEGVRKPHQ
jgi:hypothetical protein